MILLIDRIVQKIKRWYRKTIFRKKIKCPHKQFTLVGDITCINTNIQLGKGVTIYPGVMFFGDGPIIIGDNVDIGKDTVIFSSKNAGVTIGNNTAIAAQCYIIDMDHGIKAGQLITKQSNTESPVTIGNDVWLAAGVKVLKGSHIDDGAIIGAASLVKGDIENNAIAVGIPAKVKKYRE